MKIKESNGPKEENRCACCGAKKKHTYALGLIFCSPECSRMFRTGETMDDLVREASQMPESIPNNNHDYDEFDIEEMMSRRTEDE